MKIYLEGFDYVDGEIYDWNTIKEYENTPEGEAQALQDLDQSVKTSLPKGHPLQVSTAYRVIKLEIVKQVNL